MTEQDLIKLGNRVIDHQGNVVYFDDALIELLYQGIIPEGILFPENNDDVKLFNNYSYKNFDDIYYKIPETLKSLEERKNTWFYPEEYDKINLEEYFNNLVQTYPQPYKDRVVEELKLYKEKGMEKFLRFCLYFSKIIQEKDLCVGIGRGSSCASLLLYLLQIHLVNPMEYGLDIKEFLK